MKICSDFWCDNSSAISLLLLFPYFLFWNSMIRKKILLLDCFLEPHVSLDVLGFSKKQIKPPGCWQHLVGSCHLVLEERCCLSSHLETMLPDCCELWSAEPWQMPPRRDSVIGWLFFQKKRYSQWWYNWCIFTCTYSICSWIINMYIYTSMLTSFFQYV